MRLVSRRWGIVYIATVVVFLTLFPFALRDFKTSTLEGSAHRRTSGPRDVNARSEPPRFRVSENTPVFGSEVAKRESNADTQLQDIVKTLAIVAGSAAGGVLLSIIIGVAIYWFLKRRRRCFHRQQQPIMLTGTAADDARHSAGISNVAGNVLDVRVHVIGTSTPTPETQSQGLSLPTPVTEVTPRQASTPAQATPTSLEGAAACPESRSRAKSYVESPPVMGSMHDVKDSSREIDHFDPFLKNIHEKAPALVDFDPDTQSPTPVLLLDSGIQAEHKLLEEFVKDGQIKPWRTFDMDDVNSLKDTNGHGTACAFIIASVTQGAIIYSGRVCAGGKENPPLAQNIAQAILAAVKEHDEPDGIRFQLIVIPIGFLEDNPELSRAVQVALNRKILIIAAAGNEGDSCATYPADYDSVIAACSSDHLGNKSKFSASLNNKNDAPLYILGENLVLPWTSAPGKSTMLKSGTSFSAAILAGVCAALLQIASSRPQDALMLREYRKMHGVLSRIRRSNVFNPEEFKEEFISHDSLMNP
ncbi:Tk-subtilisin [Drechslerella dactyloides]|uniref:Tk-subtilisin n=1 Tax=Drechslerella dactyloides TaxID=74499 RepID=A0AAD6IRH2_DREDA|nr:Tk-subtilisin [Drechslerella dactyloides]